MIKLLNVSHYYQTPKGRKVVLDNVSIDFMENRNIAILGLNGAGKSTLIRLISGEELPCEGSVTRTSSVSWPVGFAGGFHGSLTARENLRFVCRIYGADIKKVTAYVEDFTELGMYMDMPIKTYSSGMKSRLTFALSMSIGFDFLLIDEAFSVGDVTFREKANKELEKRKKTSSLIFVSHSARAVKEHCDCGAVLHQGKLSFFDNLDEALKKYEEVCNANKR